MEYSKYLIDPDKFRFSKVVRILAIVIRVAMVFMKLLKSRSEEDRFLKQFMVHSLPDEACLKSESDITNVSKSFEFLIKFDWIKLLDEEILFIP